MDESEPVAQYLKIVSVLDVAPGHAGTPGTGEPIAIVNLAHRGEIEQPLMLRVKDVKQMAWGMIGVLGHHGDAVAKDILERYGTSCCHGHQKAQPVFGSTDETGHPRPAGAGQRGRRLSDRIEINVSFRNSKVKPLVLEVLGGCCCRQRTILLFRCDTLAPDAVEALALVGSHRTIRFRGSAVLHSVTADRVKRLTASQGFRSEGRWWKKLPKQVLKKRFAGKHLTCVG